ncbi:hypothetical protein C4K09_3293 [Pseudomonas chlororaphis subsp. aureofaciens]|nr:hypothetical protein C4K09_3293 [Pseudomonas chlororaphis subsp. aureofaciens]
MQAPVKIFFVARECFTAETDRLASSLPASMTGLHAPMTHPHAPMKSAIHSPEKPFSRRPVLPIMGPSS